MTLRPYAYAEPRPQDFLEFNPLVKPEDGIITGICHDGFDPIGISISEFEVTFDPSCPAVRNSLTPIGAPDENPFTLRRGYLTFNWYMTKAPLAGLRGVRVCRDHTRQERCCIGLLLYYEDGSIESLGQTRWDQTVMPELPTPIRIRQSMDMERRRSCITDVETALPTNVTTQDDGWQDIPDFGTIIWWFSRLDDKVCLHGV